MAICNMDCFNCQFADCINDRLEAKDFESDQYDEVSHSKKKARSDRYRALHKEVLNERSRKWNSEHAERVRETTRKWNSENNCLLYSSRSPRDY